MWPQQLLFVSRIAEKVNGHFYSSITVDTASKTRRDDVPVLGEYNRIRETHRQRGYAKQVHREGFGLRPMKFYELFAPLSSRRSLSHHVAAALLALGALAPRNSTKGEGLGRPCSLSWVWLPTSCASKIATGLKRNRALHQTIYPPGSSCI